MYAHTVEASIPMDLWDECYFSLMSLKAHLQSLPGWSGMSFTAREADGDRVLATVLTEWEQLESLTLWAQTHRTPDAVLRSIRVPPDQISVRLSEVLT